MTYPIGNTSRSVRPPGLQRAIIDAEVPERPPNARNVNRGDRTYVTKPVQWLVLATGLAPYTLELWERVASRPGHRVLLVHLDRAGREAMKHERGQLRNTRVELFPVKSRWGAVRAIRKAVRSRPDITICMGYAAAHVWGASVVLQLWARRRRVFYMSDTNIVAEARRLSSTSGAAWLFARRTVLPLIFPQALSLGLSNELAQDLLGFRRVIDLPLLGVPDPDLPPAATRDETPWSHCARPVLACIARLSREKNLSLLVAAWSNLPPEQRRGSLVFVGEGPERAALEASIRGVDSISVVGALPYWELRPMLRTLDALILPSSFEPWGLVVTEALSAGVPVLATTEVGAALSASVIAPGAATLAPSDIQGFTRALDELIRELPARQAAARAAAPEFCSRYSFGAIAERLIRLASET